MWMRWLSCARGSWRRKTIYKSDFCIWYLMPYQVLSKNPRGEKANVRQINFMASKSKTPGKDTQKNKKLEKVKWWGNRRGTKTQNQETKWNQQPDLKRMIIQLGNNRRKLSAIHHIYCVCVFSEVRIFLFLKYRNTARCKQHLHCKCH